MNKKRALIFVLFLLVLPLAFTIGSNLNETLTNDQLKVLKVVQMKYPTDFPLSSLRGTVKEYIYTVAFNLQGVTMEGKIKVFGNMDSGEIIYYLKKKIETERGINSLVESQVSDSSIGKVYIMSNINYIPAQTETRK